jgi:hypothetical protein
MDDNQSVFGDSREFPFIDEMIRPFRFSRQFRLTTVNDNGGFA